MLKRFFASEAGGSTVDWVVGAAAGVGLAMALMNSVGGAAQDHADRVDNTFSDRGIATY
ncbi:MAG: hypothetical protein AAF678_01040 [Pseudomonadota bacterium]